MTFLPCDRKKIKKTKTKHGQICKYCCKYYDRLIFTLLSFRDFNTAVDLAGPLQSAILLQLTNYKPYFRIT